MNRYASIRDCVLQPLSANESQLAEQLTLIALDRLACARPRDFITLTIDKNKRLQSSERLLNKEDLGPGGGQIAISSRMSDWVRRSMSFITNSLDVCPGKHGDSCARKRPKNDTYASPLDKRGARSVFT